MDTTDKCTVNGHACGKLSWSLIVTLSKLYVQPPSSQYDETKYNTTSVTQFNDVSLAISCHCDWQCQSTNVNSKMEKIH